MIYKNFFLLAQFPPPMSDEFISPDYENASRISKISPVFQQKL